MKERKKENRQPKGGENVVFWREIVLLCFGPLTAKRKRFTRAAIMQPIVLRLETQGGAVELELHIKGLPEEILSPRCPGDDSWEQQLQDQGKRRATLTTILRGVGRPRPTRQLRLLTTRRRDRFDASGRAGQARQARAFCRQVAGAAVWQVGRAQVRFAIGWWVRSGATPPIRCSELITPSQIAAA